MDAGGAGWSDSWWWPFDGGCVGGRLGGGGCCMLKTGACSERLVVGWAKLLAAVLPGVKGSMGDRLSCCG